MIGENGLNNMMWFVGLVEDIDDPLAAGRIRVRAYGIHPSYDEGLVLTEDLPWAQLIHGPKMMAMPDTGDTVVGFFADGRDAQHPMVIGIITSAKYGAPVFSGAGSAAGEFSNNGTPGPNLDPNDQTSVVEIIEAGRGYNIVRLADGSVVRRDGPLAWRNNNPGNIRSGSFATSRGSIGSANGFAVFPNLATGKAAAEGLLFETNSYKNLSIAAAISRYAPSNENNTAAYINSVVSSMGPGVTRNTPLSSLNSTQRQKLLGSMHAIEGFKPGKVTNINGGAVTGTNPYLAPTQHSVHNYGNPPLPPQMSGEFVEETPYLVATAARQSVTFGANNQYGIDEPDKPHNGNIDSSVWFTSYGGSNIELSGRGSGKEYISIAHADGSHVILDGNGNIQIKAVAGSVYIGAGGNVEEVVDGVKMTHAQGGYVLNVAGGALEIISAGDINLTSSGNINLSAGGRITASAGDTLELGASAINITAKNDEINMLAASNLNVQAYGGSLGLSSKGTLVLDSAGDVGLKGSNIAMSGGEIHLNTSSVAAAAGASGADVAEPPKKGVTTAIENKPVPGDISRTQIDDVEA